MPRGRKRKVPSEESAEESMDEPMETQPEATEDQPEAAEAETEGETDAAEPEADPIEAKEDTEPAAEDDDLEPGEVVPENNACPPAEELKKLKSDAQSHMTRLDVLICGKCHNAFHIVEEFLEHKETCTGSSTIISATTKSDNKPQVWAFVLYKAFKMREAGETMDVNERSWVLYQKWSALDEHLKATWVAAGKALMGIQQYATPVKKATPRHHMHHAAQIAASEQHKQTLIQIQKDLEDDDPMPVQSTPKGRPGNTAKKVKHDEEVDRGELRKRAGLNQVWRKSLRQGADETETELFTVEKIVAKRANPKLKSAEYLVRWAGLPSDQNSWEHASNLLTCKPIVEEFERNLARQKARKAAEAARLAEKTAIQNAGGRPVRTSALKALDQVKEWVGSKGADEEEEYQVISSGGIKKRIATSKENPLIMASSRGGLLKIDQSQMANLTSGVYIISDQSGLVKVEDRAASKLTSCLNDSEGTPVANNRSTMMINETEVRKISNNKYASFRKDSSGLIRKENSSPYAAAQKRTLTSTPKPAQRQVVQQKARTPGVLANRQNSQAILGRSSAQQQKLMRIISEDNSVLASEDGSLNITGSILGEDGNETMVDEGDVDDDGLMRMTISPGGSLHQIVQQRPKQQEQQIAQGTEIMQIEGEDGVIYNLTPEQQQMLLQNGTLTMDAKQESLEDNTEMVIENGQIVRRMIGSGDGDAEEGTFMLAGDNLQGVKVEQEADGEDESMLTLQSAVQEAVQGPRVTFSTDDGTIDAAVISADPLAPGATVRGVLLQAADGTLFSTEMEEEQFQTLGFETK